MNLSVIAKQKTETGLVPPGPSSWWTQCPFNAVYFPEEITRQTFFPEPKQASHLPHPPSVALAADIVDTVVLPD